MTDTVKQGQFAAAVKTVCPDFDPLILIAWAVHETGWFKKVIGHNNFFGMKMPKSEKRRAMIDRPPALVPTAEIIRYDQPDRLTSLLNANLGNIIKIYWQPAKKRWVIKLYAQFADWSREGKALKYIRQYLQDLFPIAWANRKHARRFVSGLVDGRRKFATDPDYKRKWLAVYKQVKDAASSNSY